MELTDLRHFSNVAVAASFSRGATLSHVTTPAVRKSVRKLEEELRGEGAKIDGDLRIAAMEVLSIDLLPRALGILMRRHPGLRPVTYEMVPFEMESALREGRIELGLTIGGTEQSGITWLELGRSPGVLVAGRGHPLFRRRRVTAAHMLQHPFVVPRFLGFEHLPPLDQFPEERWPRRVGATIKLLQMGIRLCAEGVCLGSFPEISVRAELRSGQLSAIGGLPPRPPFVLRAAAREKAPLRPAARALIESLTARINAVARRP